MLDELLLRCVGQVNVGAADQLAHGIPVRAASVRRLTAVSMVVVNPGVVGVWVIGVLTDWGHPNNEGAHLNASIKTFRSVERMRGFTP